MLVPIDLNQGIKKSEVEIEDLSFSSLGLREGDIEEFLRLNIDLLFGDNESLLVIGQQVRNQQGGRSDLVALDENGNLVLIEIKRDLQDIRNRKEPFEFQAIRYAANYAKIKDVDDLVDNLFVPYIERHRNEYEESVLTTSEMARRRITSFLAKNNAVKTFNRKQRIVLVAAEFDAQTLSACAWLINNHVDINCFKIHPVKIGEQYLLSVNPVLPPTPIEDFYVEIFDEKSRATSRVSPDETGMSRTYLPRMPKLFEWGIVQKDDLLTIKDFEDSEAKALNPKEVEFNGERMSYNQWGQKVTGWSSICIYEWAKSQRLDDLLDKLRREKMAELSREGSE